MSLPLLPAVPFTEGDLVNPELMYLAMYAPVRDGLTQYLGHLPKIADEELSDTSGQIKSRVAAIETGLQTTHTTGLNVQVAAGSVRLPSGLIASIPTTALTAANNSTQFVWVDSTGALGIGTTPPVVRCLLAQVVTSGGSVTTVTDLRNAAQRVIMPVTSSIKVFGGTNLTDKVCTNLEVLSDGYYYFRNFTVPSGVSVTISGFSRIYCSGSVNIQGTVTVTPLAGGGQGFATGIPLGINIGGIGGTGIGGGSGSNATGGVSYNYAAQPYGSGGGLGYAITTTNLLASFGNGGSGGGGFWLEAAGAITVGSSAIIQARGGNATVNTITSGTNAVIGGNGGGSGGLILLSSLMSVTVSAGATLDVRGGNGSAAVTNSSLGGTGGGGGGGGVVAIFSPSLNVSGANILLAGGVNGADVGAPGGIGGGNGGGFGGAGAGGGGGRTVSQVGRSFLLNFVPIGS